MTRNQSQVLYKVNETCKNLREEMDDAMYRSAEPMDDATYERYRAVYDALCKVQDLL